MRRSGNRDPQGQVLVLFAILLTVLLAAAGLSIDIGRQVAERRHIQNAADAAALAACRALMDGASDAAAATQARTVARINIENSPSGTTAQIAADSSRVYTDGHLGDPDYLLSGVLISGTSVRVAISSSVGTILARLVGVPTLETNARAHCQLQGGPAVPIVARRYEYAPGPGGGFTDFLATDATSTSGQQDTSSVLGYDIRTPASESAPGPIFELYGPGAKSANVSAFRGFVALDVRNFASTTSRLYYNGVTPGISETTLKDKEGEYLITGYPGPTLPSITDPADPNDQVAALEGNDSPMVVGNFETAFSAGDRVLLAVYDGTVMEIPGFSITPPSSIDLPSTTATPTDGPTFIVSRNDAFNSTVTLHLRGDSDADVAGHPEFDLIPDPSVTPPAAGQMDEPTWSTNVFLPTKKGTRVTMQAMSTNAIAPGIYTVWLEGNSGDPYYQTRRTPVAVRIGGATSDFSFENSTTTGSTSSLGGTITIPIYVSTTSAASTKWGSGSTVALSVDESSLTDCSLNPVAIAPGQLTMSPTSVTPTSTGSGALSTLSISTVGLNSGCYTVNVRGYGTNDAGQPVTHLQPITFYVATTGSNGNYVDVTGFAVFEITSIDSNSIFGRAVTGVAADPADPSLRRAEQPRLIPW